MGDVSVHSNLLVMIVLVGVIGVLLLVVGGAWARQSRNAKRDARHLIISRARNELRRNLRVLEDPRPRMLKVAAVESALLSNNVPRQVRGALREAYVRTMSYNSWVNTYLDTQTKMTANRDNVPVTHPRNFSPAVRSAIQEADFQLETFDKQEKYYIGC